MAILRSGTEARSCAFSAALGTAAGPRVPRPGLCVQGALRRPHRDLDPTVSHRDPVEPGCIVEHRGIGHSHTLWRPLGVEPPWSA